MQKNVITTQFVVPSLFTMERVIVICTKIGYASKKQNTKRVIPISLVVFADQKVIGTCTEAVFRFKNDATIPSTTHTICIRITSTKEIIKMT